MSVKRVERQDDPRYIVWWKDERRRSRNKTFRRKADADAYNAKIKVAKRTGEFASFDAGKEPLRDFCEEWLRLYAEPHLAKTTLAGYRRYLKSDILPALGHVPLRNLTAHRSRSSRRI